MHVDPDWWKTLFDEVYLKTDARSVCNDEITRQEINIFCELIPLHKDQQVLDLCGGQGRHSLELCRRGFSNCTVLDYSRILLDIGKKNAGAENLSVAFVQGDARDTLLAQEKYDHVLILGNSLGYISDGNADLQIFKESLRLLKSRGRLLVDVANAKLARQKLSPNTWHEIGRDLVVCRQRELNNNTISAREMVISKDDGLVRDKTYAIRLYEKEHLVQKIQQAGFSDIQVHSDASAITCLEDVGCMNHRLVISAEKP